MSNQLLQLILTQAWQIAALAIVVALANHTVAKNRPHLAHALWLLVLLKCVTPPIWGHSLGLFSQLQAIWSADPVVQQDFASDEPLLMPQRETDDEFALVPPAADPPLPGIIVTNKSEVASMPLVPVTLPTETADSSFVLEANSWKPSWPIILLSLVAIGAVLTLSAMIVRCVLCLRHIRQHRTTEFDESLNEQLQRLAKKLRLRRVPRIIVSDVLFGPAVIGLWRHVIVLPRCLLKAESGERKADDVAFSTDRLSAVSFPLSNLDPILAHELLHIRRGDLRTGTLQAIAQSLWWFHPAVWLCNRWLSREAERCCDEQVIAELGCSPAQYARSLLSVIESKHQLQPIPVFPGMKPVEITSQRMERIMSLKSNLKKQTPLWCWLAVALLAIVVLPGAVAQQESNKPTGQSKEREQISALQTTIVTRSQHANDQSAPLEKLVTLDLKNRSFYSTMVQLHHEHPFMTINWTDPVFHDLDAVNRRINYSCQNKRLGSALEDIVKAAGLEFRSEGSYAIEIRQPKGSGRVVESDGQGQPSDSATDWTSNQIRWNESLTLSPESLPESDAVIASVNDAPIRVNDVVVVPPASDSSLTSHVTVLRALQQRFGDHLAREVLLQKLNLSEEDWIDLEASISPQILTEIEAGEKRVGLQWYAQEATTRESHLRSRLRGRVLGYYKAAENARYSFLVDQGREAILNAQLRTPVSFTAQDQTLLQVVELLSNKFAINLEILPLHAEMATRTTDQTVSIQQQNIPLHDLIRTVIEPYGLVLTPQVDRVRIALSNQTQEQFATAVPPSYGIFGRVKNTGWKELNSSVRILDAIRQAEPEEHSNGLDITHSRMQSSAGRPKHRTVSLANLEADETGELNCLLQDGDIITIRRDPNSRGPVPTEKAAAGLNTDGAVRAADLIETRYDVHDLVSTLRDEQKLSEAEVRGKLLSLLEAVAPPVFGFHVLEHQVVPMVLPSDSQVSSLSPDTPMPPHEKLSSFRWDGDQYCVVRQTDASHKKLQNAIERFRSHGFRQFEITATCISGPENDIAELVRSSVGDKHELMRKNEVATCIVPKQEADAIQHQVQTSSTKFMVQRPKLLAFNGQEAIFHTGQLKPWIVGFDEKDEPIVQTMTDGFSLQVTAIGLDHGLMRLQSIATLENATRVQHASISRNSAETPRQTQIPSVHVRRVQTTVELNNEQTFIQCGLTRAHNGESKATIVVIDVKPVAYEMATAKSEPAVAQTALSHPGIDFSSNAQNGGTANAIRVENSQVPKQNENGATLQKLPMPLTLVKYYVGDLVIPVNSGDKKPDYASIMELTKATIEPDSWHDGAAIEVDRDTFSLVIRQTPRIHEQIKAFLQEVRKDTRQIQVSCRLMKLTTDEQLKGVQERCSMHPLNHHKSWALLTKNRSDEITQFLTDKHTEVLMCPNITTLSGMMATLQLDPEERGDRWLRSLGFGSGKTTTLFRGCAIGVEPRIVGDSSVIRLKHSVYLNLNPASENTSGPLTGDAGTPPLSVDESLVSSGQTLLLLIDTTEVTTEDAALDSTTDNLAGSRGKYVLMLTVTRLEEEASSP